LGQPGPAHRHARSARAFYDILKKKKKKIKNIFNVFNSCNIFSQDVDYRGDYTILEGPAVFPNLEGPWGGQSDCASGWASIKCRCDMEPLDCVPEDSYSTVIQCDNTLSEEVSECNYIQVLDWDPWRVL
jgi:hypothetical protein